MKILRIFIIFIILFVNYSVAIAEDGWNEYRGRYFLVYYKNAPKDLIKQIDQSSEQYYREITNKFGFIRSQTWAWDNKAKIYVYDDKDDYVNTGKLMNWSSGIALARQKIIRTFPSAHGFFDSTLPHELGHIIFREFIGYRTSIPYWFEEGVAMYQEKARRWGAGDDVKKAMKDGKFLSLDKLEDLRLTNDSDQDLIKLFYSESASAVKFIIDTMGSARFERFCRKLKEGKPFDWALASVYPKFSDMEKLNTLWMREIN